MCQHQPPCPPAGARTGSPGGPRLWRLIRNRDRDRIFELAAVAFRGDGEILDEYATVVDPVTISTSATREIHGLTDEQVAGAPRSSGPACL